MDFWIWPILLLGLGLGLLVAETILPSGGLLGVIAGICLVGSYYLVAAGSMTVGFRWLVLEAVMVPATWLGALYALPRTKLARQVYLQPPTIADLDELDSRAATSLAVGRAGRVLTPLRPTGMVEIGGQRFEAIAESGFIAVGTTIQVIAVRSRRILVRVDPMVPVNPGNPGLQ